MNHTVQWGYRGADAVSPLLTYYWVQIERPDGTYVGAKKVALSTQSQIFTLDPGDYVERVCGCSADGAVKEGWIERPFTLGPRSPPVAEVERSRSRVGRAVTEPPEPPAEGMPDKALWDAHMIEYGTQARRLSEH